MEQSRFIPQALQPYSPETARCAAGSDSRARTSSYHSGILALLKNSPCTSTRTNHLRSSMTKMTTVAAGGHPQQILQHRQLDLAQQDNSTGQNTLSCCCYICSESTSFVILSQCKHWTGLCGWVLPSQSSVTAAGLRTENKPWLQLAPPQCRPQLGNPINDHHSCIIARLVLELTTKHKPQKYVRMQARGVSGSHESMHYCNFPQQLL